MDYRLFDIINEHAGRIDRIDDFFEVISRYGPFALVILLLGLWFWPGSRADRDDRQWACIAATVSAALALGLNQVIIHLWERPRPFAAHQVVLLLKPSPDPSFPSDHATFAFAVAVSIVLVSRRIGIVALAMAALIGFSRVYVGEHYVSDVVVGALIGAVTAFGVFQLRPLAQPIIDRPMRLARRVRLA